MLCLEHERCQLVKFELADPEGESSKSRWDAEYQR